MSAFWHPFASMGEVAGNEVTMVRGEGVYLWDTDGKRYLDGTAGLWFANVGYARTEIADAVRDQLNRLHAFHTFADYTNEPVEKLTQRLASLAPHPGSRVFLGSGGSDAIDTAGKLARRYFHQIGEPQRRVFIFREWSYHGMHALGTSITGMPANRDLHGDLVDDVVRVPYDSTEALGDAIDRVGSENVAAMFCEPVIGAGGVRFAPEPYLKEARQLIADAGALFIADEVITAFGRVGDWFAANRFSLEPDMIAFAKGVTSGYMPLGGVIVAPEVAAPFWQAGSPPWRHGYTYSGHPAVCAGALANLDIIERERLSARVLEYESVLTEKLAPLAELAAVSEIRSGVGLLAAVQLDEGRVAADPDFAYRIADSVRDHGVITRAVGGGGLQVSPPLTISDAELDELVAGHRAGIEAAT